MASSKVGSIGEYIREQRQRAKVSLRQLAETTGVSNPYLSQIERGLRKPSADILQQLARALHVSAETLYVQAGILDPRDGPEPDLEHEILRDASLSESQKQAMIEVYRSFQREGRERPETGTP
jgi:transcriptional regulator with XRE-family HTH domain